MNFWFWMQHINLLELVKPMFAHCQYKKRPLGWLKARYDDQFLLEVRKSNRAALTRQKTQKQISLTERILIQKRTAKRILIASGVNAMMSRLCRCRRA
jgi:hypothetical protein